VTVALALLLLELLSARLPEILAVLVRLGMAEGVAVAVIVRVREAPALRAPMAQTPVPGV